MACALVWFSMLKSVATCRNGMAKRTQHVTPNLMLRYVAFKCWDWFDGLYFSKTDDIFVLYNFQTYSSHAFKSIRIPHLKYDNALIIYHMLFHKVRRCEVLPPSSNAVIVGQCLTIYLSVCRMQCNEGYEAVGSVERRCGLSANGVMAWTGTPLQCIGEWAQCQLQT